MCKLPLSISTPRIVRPGYAHDIELQAYRHFQKILADACAGWRASARPSPAHPHPAAGPLKILFQLRGRMRRSLRRTSGCISASVFAMG